MIMTNIMSSPASAPTRSAPIRTAPTRGGGPAAIEMGSPTGPEVSQARKNMMPEKLFSEPIDADSRDEGLVITMGRKQHESHREMTLAEQLLTPPSWQDSVETYAALTQIQPGDTFKNGLVVEHEGHKYTVTSVDPVKDANGHTRLRIGSGNNCLILEDLIKTARQETLSQIDALPPEQQSAETRMASAFFKGEPIDAQLAKEVAQNMGFMTPDSILDIAKNLKGPDGKLLLTPDDIKILSGQKIEPATPTPPIDEAAAPADGEVAVEAPVDTQPKLSEKAEELQKIFNGELVLDVPQIKAALFALGIPTDSSQLRDILRDAQHELERTQSDLSGFTHQGETDQLAKKHAMETRIEELKKTVAGYTRLKEGLVKDTGSDAFDSVAAYYDIVQSGKGDTAFLESFVTAIQDPTVENISRFDDSYTRRCGEHMTAEDAKKRKAFLKKLVMGSTAGMGALLALNIYNAAKKKDER